LLTQEILLENFSNRSVENFFLVIMDAKMQACLNNNSQKGNILKRITVVSKNGVANSHEVSWRNAVKAIDQERCAAN
jgi:hypothetical protein